MLEKKIKVIVEDEGIDETEQKVKNLDDSLENLDDTQEKLSNTQKENTQTVLDNGGAMGLLNAATGGLAQTVKDTVEASALFTKQSKVGMAVQKAYTFVMGASTGAMKAFKIALISTGIGAIVIAIGLLIANFDKVKKAVMNFIPGLAELGKWFGKVIDTVTDFIGVTSDATRELDKMNKAATKMIEQNQRLLDGFGDTLSDYQKRYVEIANELAAKIKEIQDDEVMSTEQKAIRIKELQERAKRDLLQNIEDTAKAAAEKTKEAEDAAAEKAQERADKRKEAAEQEIQDELDRQKAVDEILTEYEDRKADDDAETEEQKLELEQERRLAELEALEASEEEKMNVILYYRNAIREAQDEADEIAKEKARVAAEEKKVRDQEAHDAELAAAESLKNQKVAILDNTIGIVGALAKKGSAIHKAIAIQDIVRTQIKGVSEGISNLAVANAAAIAASPLTGGMPMVAINTAQVVTGLALSAVGAGKAIKDILSESKTPATPSGAGAGGGGGGGGRASSAPSFNIVEGTGTNQISESLNAQNETPQKAFVVSQDMTTQQELDRNILEGASL